MATLITTTILDAVKREGFGQQDMACIKLENAVMNLIAPVCICFHTADTFLSTINARMHAGDSLVNHVPLIFQTILCARLFPYAGKNNVDRE